MSAFIELLVVSLALDYALLVGTITELRLVMNDHLNYDGIIRHALVFLKSGMFMMTIFLPDTLQAVLSLFLSYQYQLNQ